MLKLLRIENTNIFVVVSEDEFIKNMKLEGVVRIEEDYSDDEIRSFTPQSIKWYEEITKLKNIKRKEIYSQNINDKRIYVSLVEILINYFNAAEKSYIIVKHLYNLVHFMYKCLQCSDMIGKYSISVDLDLSGIERVLLYYASIFGTTDEDLEMNSTIYYIAPNTKRKSITEKYVVDENITSIIKAFVEKNG